MRALDVHVRTAAAVFDVPITPLKNGGRVTLAQSAARTAVIWYAREVMLLSYPEIAEALNMNNTSVRARHLWAKREYEKRERFWERLGILCGALGQSIDQTEMLMNQGGLPPRAEP
jgi:hypothetical protein